MECYKDYCHLPYTVEQLYDLVLAVDQYPEFLPWCLAARTYQHEKNQFLADLLIGYGPLQHSYTSLVSFERPRKIWVTLYKGPFKSLNNLWLFDSEPSGGCRVKFFLDFELKFDWATQMLRPMWDEAASKILEAFHKRAHHLYGKRGEYLKEVERRSQL